MPEANETNERLTLLSAEPNRVSAWLNDEENSLINDALTDHFRKLGK